jgi:TraM recognition site of TraD and TraG
MIIKLAIALVIVLIVAAFAAWAFLPARHLPGNRARHLRIRLHLRLHPGKGFAHLFSLHLRWGRLAALRRSGRIRPALPLRYRLIDSREHAVFLGRAHYRHRLHVPFIGRHGPTQDLQNGVPGRRHPAPPRPGHRHHYQARHLRADERGPRRARPGPRLQPAAHRQRAVHVLLVPGGRLPGPGHRDPPRRRVRLRRVPEGCRRRQLLVRQSLRLPARLLPRRRPGRYDLRAVAAWVSGADPDVPERILAAAGAHQWAHVLSELRSEAHKTTATVRMVMSRALSFMADPALAASVLPAPGTGFRIPAFLRDAGTLYMIAEAVSEEAPVAPLFAAMATEIHYVAAQMGQASSSGRLDPPLLMGEVTQICPVPLPSWLSDSGGKGIQVVAVVHGEAQLTGRWGDHGRQVVLDTSSVKVFLPGITDTTTLDAAAKLCGQASWKVRGQDHATRHDVATPDMIRQLPAGFALVIRGGCAPVIARLPRAWKNPAYRRARRLGQLPAEPAETGAYPVLEQLEAGIPDHVPAEWLPGDGTSYPWS